MKIQRWVTSGLGWGWCIAAAATGLALSAGCQGAVGGGGAGTGGTDQTGSGGVGGTGSTIVPGGSGGGTGNGGTGNGGTGAPPPGSGGRQGTGGSAVAIDCTKPQAAPVRAQLLSSSQYTHTVQDLFKATGDPGRALGDKVFNALDFSAVEQRASVAEGVAKEAAVNVAAWAPCTPPATGDASACEQMIIDKIGPRAYRRALTAAEKTEMKTLFDAGIKEKDFATGVEWFLTGLLQSPDFMYELYRPDANEVAGEVRPLSSNDYASRLAFFLWDSAPDDTLLTAASANELGDATKRQAQIARMMQDPKFTRGIESFYRSWLHLEAFRTLARNAQGFDASVVQSLSTSLLMSATQLYTSATPNISGLFTGQSYYMDGTLRSFYGLTGTGTTFTPATMSGQNRRGIVTHPGLMAALARPGESFPVSRGLFIVRTLLCHDIPLPNGITIPEPPPVMDGVSTRQRYEAHSSSALCRTCHTLFDPAGFALESYDEVGRYRTVDHGVQVNTSGTMAVDSDIDGAFATGDELLARLADSKDVRTCFAKQYLKFALTREALLTQDLCSAEVLGRDFAPSGDLKQLVSSLASTDAFRMRLAEGVAR
jgi:hypothetical protein